ncbi:hypothetical protein [Streptomyces anulatus]|uniref:hypothetical protein n=1 Tax=Streptomyces anulatus TaxID=1892 RepID=UPI003694B8F7
MTEKTPAELREQRARLIASTGLTETVLRERADAHQLYPEHHDIWVTVEGLDMHLAELAEGPEPLREGLAAAVDERDRARRWAVSLENENRRLVDQAREAKEQARVATVAALNLQRQTPDAAQRTLGRIREARTWVAVWVELGQYFGLTAEQCGVEARARRLGDSL